MCAASVGDVVGISGALSLVAIETDGWLSARCADCECSIAILALAEAVTRGLEVVSSVVGAEVDDRTAVAGAY